MEIKSRKHACIHTVKKKLIQSTHEGKNPHTYSASALHLGPQPPDAVCNRETYPRWLPPAITFTQKKTVLGQAATSHTSAPDGRYSRRKGSTHPTGPRAAQNPSLSRAPADSVTHSIGCHPGLRNPAPATRTCPLSARTRTRPPAPTACHSGGSMAGHTSAAETKKVTCPAGTLTSPVTLVTTAAQQPRQPHGLLD